MSAISLTTPNGSQVPLKNINVDVNVHNHISQFTMTQTYMNNEDNSIEAFYTFPTSNGASVFSFEAKIGDKVIKTLIKEKAEAEKEYNKAISEGNGTLLMQRVSGEVFTVSLGNVSPKSEIIITIKYIVELRTEIDCTRLRLCLPLTMMPRYTSVYDPTPASLLHGNLVNPTKVNEKPYNLSFRGKVTMTDGIVSLDSKTCKVKLSNMKELSLDFEINDVENLNEDIIMTITRNTPKSTCSAQRADDLQLTNELYRNVTMVNINPSFKDVAPLDPKDTHYVIVLDNSGSMGGQDMENCKTGAKLFIMNLPPGSTFDVYKFNSDFEKFKPCGDTDTRIQAMKWIDTIRSEGGTELKRALEDVYCSIKQTGKSGVIVLLSDGGVSDTINILKLAKQNRGTSVFTIGIGQSVSRELIQGLADMSNGVAEFVNSGTDEIKEKILAQLRRAQRKSHKENDIKIDVDGPFRMVPETIPTLYENDINTFYIFSTNPVKSVSYVQTFKDYALNTVVPCTTLTETTYPLHRAAGIKLIDCLLCNPKGSQIEHLQQDPYKEEIISVSLNLNILSNYTSFVGVEYREEVDKTTDKAVLREVPLQVAKKYQYNYASTGCQGPTGPQGVCGPRGPIGTCGPIGAYGPRGMRRGLGPGGLLESRGQGDRGDCSRNISSRSMGINTIGSSLQNSSYDMCTALSPKLVSSPWLNSSVTADYNLGNLSDVQCRSTSDVQCRSMGDVQYRSTGDRYSRNKDGMKGGMRDRYSINCCNNEENEDDGGCDTGFFGTLLNSGITPKLTLRTLPDYSTSGTLLVGTNFGSLSESLKVNDYIFVTGEGSNNGMYKVWNTGSETNKWILEKV